LISERIPPAIRDIGGFNVSRLLPSKQQRAIGPFVFFDRMGPAQFAPGLGIDVRPHPHIGLATLTFLYEGEIEHRDSLGTVQLIHPDEVNWMVAGYGITHSERTNPKTRAKAHPLSGIQTWIALPDEHEETEPRFEHFGVSELPTTETDGARLRLVVGSAFGLRAPARTYSDMFFADALLEPNASLRLGAEHQDRGIFVGEGSIQIGGDVYNEGELLVAQPQAIVEIVGGANGARLALLGGKPMSSPRRLWWNFVASSQEKIDAAKQSWQQADWSGGRFQLPPDDNDEFIPLPD
jgi:redox-sensitive bicupin YhaK (pirin superfamily)